MPVILSEGVAISRMVEEAGAGIVVPCEAMAIAEAAEALLGNALQRQQMGQAGKGFVSTRYSLKAVGEEMTALYSKIITNQ